MTRYRRALVVAVCLGLLAVPVTAGSATVSVGGPSSVEAGGTVTLDVAVTNTAENESYFLVNVSAPDGWDVVGHSDDGGRWDSDETSWIWLSVEPGEDVTPSVTLAVPSDATEGAVGASALDDSGTLDTAVHTVSVGSGDGSGTDDSGGDGTDGGDSDGGDGETDDSDSAGTDGGDSDGGGDGTDGSDGDSGGTDTVGTDADDTVDGGDGAYSGDSDGEYVTEESTGSSVTEAEPPTPETTERVTDTGSAPETDTGEEASGSDSTATSGDGPGFTGVGAVGAFVLVTVGILAFKRRS